MKNITNNKWIPILLLMPLLALGAGGYAKLTDNNNVPREISGIYFVEPEHVVPFQLDATNGNSFTDEDFKDQWTLMFFGFTYCPDVCPTTLAMLDKIVKQLSIEHPDIKTPHVVFISVDPERDNLDKLKNYVTYFNQDFIAATGSPVQLRKLARQVGVVYDKVFINPNEPESYLMEHSTSISLINPQGGVQAIFTAPHDADTLSKDILAVVSE